MLIPTEGENLLCLARVVALYREDNVTTILREDGTAVATSFTPQTLKKRGEVLWNRYAVLPGGRWLNSVNMTEELYIDE